MPKFYLDIRARENGDFEVHADGCRNMPEETDRLYLGNYVGCEGAVAVAKRHHPDAKVCYHCARDWHRQ